MAHLLDNSKGFYGYVGVGAPAWHGLGKTFAEGTILTAEETLQQSGQDFTVIKAPNIHAIPDPNNPGEFEEIVSENSFFTYRTDTRRILGDKLGRDYTVLQNHEAFALIDEILQTGAATIETAGAIDGGKKVFICLKVNSEIIVNGKDNVKQYLLFTTAHDGSGASIVMFTNIRVVCNNTLSAALGQAKSNRFAIRHTANQKDRLKEALKVMGMVKMNEEINAANYAKMAETVISKEQMFSYFGNIFLDEKEVKELQSGKRLQEVASSQKQNTLANVLRFATTGQGQSLTMKGNDFTAWTAYNAVTGHIARQKYDNADSRANALLFGTAANRIQEAGVLALAPEKIKPCHKIITDNFNLN